MSKPLDADEFSAAIAALRSQPRYTAEHIASGAARKLSSLEVAQLRDLADEMPDLAAMLDQWVCSDLPLTDQDLAVMRQASKLWQTFSDGAYKRASESPL